jgi:thiol-disulfide isomerase/thioredoxin
MRRFSPILALVSLLCITSCNPSTPTSEPIQPSTDAPTSEITPTLPSGPIVGEIPAGTYLYNGDQMYDFTFTDIDGQTHNLASELQEKKMVVLNFFASWCGPCVSEFPAMQTAYAKYDDKASLFALTISFLSRTHKLLSSVSLRYCLKAR